MAVTLTCDQAQQIIHRIYEGNTDYPSLGEEDYTIRMGFMNDAIEEWGDKADMDNVKWRELFTDLSSATDGDKVTSNGVSLYSAPSNFIDISSFVSVGGVTLPYTSPDQVMFKLSNNSSEQFFYIVGDKSSGYDIKINPVPTGVETISYSYYKCPTLLTTSTDKFEMRKPYFAIYHTLARLYELDNRNDLVSFYEGKKKAVMDSMIIDNEIPPFGNLNNIQSLTSDIDGVGFGK